MYLVSNDLSNMCLAHNSLNVDLSAVTDGIVGLGDTMGIVALVRNNILMLKSKYEKLLKLMPDWKKEIDNLLKSFDEFINLANSCYDDVTFAKNCELVSLMSKFVTMSADERERIKNSGFNMIVSTSTDCLGVLKSRLLEDTVESEGKDWLSNVWHLLNGSITIRVCRYLDEEVNFLFSIFDKAVSIAKEINESDNYLMVYSSLTALIDKIQTVHDII